jgi:hypothetical protein
MKNIQLHLNCVYIFYIRLHLPNDYISKAYTQHRLEHVGR